VIATEDGIDLPGPGLGGQVDGELLQGPAHDRCAGRPGPGSFGRSGIGRRTQHYLVKVIPQLVDVDALQLRSVLAHLGVPRVEHEGQNQQAAADLLEAQLVSHYRRRLEQLDQLGRQGRLGLVAGGQRVQDPLQRPADGYPIHPEGIEDLGHVTGCLVQQPQQ
jgi:hypothetical protein